MILLLGARLVTPAKPLLVQAAHSLRKTVYASLPWGFRIATLLVEAGFAADPEGFGRLVGGVFLLHGVRGMPSAPITPRTHQDLDRLPKGYGLDLGLAARAVARKFFTQEAEIDDLLATVGVKVLSDPTVHRAIRGRTLGEAKSYLLRTVSNRARDMLRSERVRRHEDLDDLLKDPVVWSNLGEIIPEREQTEIRRELETAVSPRLLPDLPLYFDLLMDGYSNAEIANNRMLPSLKEHPMSQQALAKYRERLRAVLQRHFEVRASMLAKSVSWSHEPY